MKRGDPLKRKTELARTELKRGDKPLKRKAALVGSRARANGIGVPTVERVTPTGETFVYPKRRAVSPASPTQRAKVRDLGCIVCGADPVTPAHLIDRSLTTVGQDDPLAVVPLCITCHRSYDTGSDLLPYLEPAWRAELAFAVVRVGLVTTYRRVTNTRQALE